MNVNNLKLLNKDKVKSILLKHTGCIILLAGESRYLVYNKNNNLIVIHLGLTLETAMQTIHEHWSWEPNESWQEYLPNSEATMKFIKRVACTI